ncbi:MAG: type III pantothenate kinase [Gammaproteobacteria bacterium]|nr:type III pantothenate kinase [Gammaproteobacteria bacterium]NIR82050.1 type III pantothenate kinase [Gammaproteobacteria bacterium]NIR89278.1 type III pantothenate kinase [Gammaproteobacteria bacterium]NIU03160.1 type III pantothenate kinase [Gammaproteobacteria bacterium]NIV50676.1 type III pantothenate kinase [Gammaproteobacteria bacterium]
MTLLLDIGNSRIKWARLQGGALGARGGVLHRGEPLEQRLDERWGSLTPPQAVLACSVASPDVGAAVSAWMARRWGARCRFVEPETRALGVVNAYPAPTQLGADRWAALIAAHHRYPGARCIVGCGTATTIDVLDAAGAHHGGLIVPGVRLMREALLRDTDRIREVSGAVAPLLARSTPDAVTTGAVYALTTLIERVVAEAGAELGAPLPCLVTGGDAELVRAHLRCDSVHTPDLVLEGLGVIAEAEP